MSVSTVQLVLLGTMFLVVLVSVWCWRSRIITSGGLRKRRFHRSDVAVTGGVCVLVLAVLVALLPRL